MTLTNPESVNINYFHSIELVPKQQHYNIEKNKISLRD